MTEILPYKSSLLLEASFTAVEFSFPDVEIEDLATGIGRYGIFSALVDHQQAEGFNPEGQVWAGIDATSLVVRRALFSEANLNANSERLGRNFNATQLNHWRSILGEVKYSPFTYIYKAIQRGENNYPAIVGFDRSKLIATHQDDENIDWRPIDGETVESSLQSIYYFEGMFPRLESAGGGFDIPPHLIPEDPKALLEMLDFINETNTGYTYQEARRVWAEANYPEAAFSILDNWAQDIAFHFEHPSSEEPLDFESAPHHKQNLQELLTITNGRLSEIIKTFNESFFGSNSHELEIAASKSGKGITILGKVRPTTEM